MKNRIIIVSLALFMILGLMSCGKTSDYELIPVKSGSKWGYVNHEGKYVINPQFDRVWAFKDGMALVKNDDGDYGYINEKGTLVIPYKYKEATSFNDGLAMVVEKGSCPICIDKSDNMVFSLPDHYGCSVMGENGLFLTVGENQKIMYIDKKGGVVLSPDSVFNARLFSNGVAFFCDKNGDWGLMDKKGKIVAVPQFKLAQSTFTDDLAAVYDGKQWGYITSDGKYSINPQFEEVGGFNEGLALIKVGKQYGYIDKEGRIVINPQFDKASTFKYGIASVKVGDKWGIIDKQGQFCANPQFEGASFPLSDNLVLVYSNSKWGGVDRNGKFVFNPQFDDINLEFELLSSVKTQQSLIARDFIKKMTNLVDNDACFSGVSYGTTSVSVGYGASRIKTFTVNQDYQDGMHCDNITVSCNYKGQVMAWHYDFSNQSDIPSEDIARALGESMAKKLNLKLESIPGGETNPSFIGYNEKGKLSFCVSYTQYGDPLIYFMISFDKELIADCFGDYGTEWYYDDYKVLMHELQDVMYDAYNKTDKSNVHEMMPKIVKLRDEFGEIESYIDNTLREDFISLFNETIEILKAKSK